MAGRAMSANWPTSCTAPWPWVQAMCLARRHLQTRAYRCQAGIVFAPVFPSRAWRSGCSKSHWYRRVATGLAPLNCWVSACARCATRSAIMDCHRGGAMSLIDTPMLQLLGRFLDVSVFRHSLIASNMANIDTPGYRTQDLNFRSEMQRATGDFEYASFSPAVRKVEGLIERPDGNNVSLERESLLLAETQLRFQQVVHLLR